MYKTLSKNCAKKRFAETIRIQRYRRKISQETLAELAGISTKYMNMIENQVSSPTLHVIANICNILDIDFNECMK